MWRTVAFRYGTLSAAIVLSAQIGLAQLPDLQVTNVDASAISWSLNSPNSDGSLNFTGTVQCTVQNLGIAASAATSILIFGDRNGNSAYDAGDAIYGTAPVGALNPGQSATVSVAVAGTARFWNELFYALVDPDNTVVEASEGNNLGSSAQGCSVTRTPRFDPQLKYHWGVSVQPQIAPEFVDVQSTPIVADIDLDGVPEIIFLAGNGRTDIDETQMILRVIRGDTGADVWADTTRRYDRVGHLAVGNLDDDPELEIVVMYKLSPGTAGTLVAYEHDGTFKWESVALGGRGGAPTIADLDGDGRAEVVFGNVLLNGQTGARIWTGLGTAGGYISVVADIDLDGAMEVVAGPTVYNRNGSVKWRAQGVSDGFTAVANLDDDPQLEIVIAGGNRLYVLEHDGSVKWSLGGSFYGPPAIAKIDANDAYPAILVAGCNILYAVNANGTVKWSNRISDGSCRTGSTVFDFEGDGLYEVVYRDERYLYVFRGSDGTQLFRANSSAATWTESLTIADADADGSADIIVGINRVHGTLPSGQDIGIQVWESATRSWLPTRRIWNQHAYSITNVNDDGSIPRYITPNWVVGYNSFRTNAPGQGLPPAPAPDLTAYLWRSCHGGGLTARVGNGGGAPSPAGVTVKFYQGDPSSGGVLIGQTTVPALNANEYVDVSVSWSAPILGATVYVVLGPATDSDGNVTECVTTNNQHSRCFLPGDVNGDGRVDRQDLQAVRRAFGRPAVNPRADVNCDGRVNDADLLIVLVTQGRSCQ